MLASFGQVSALEMDSSARLIANKRSAGRFDIRPGRCPSSIPFAGEKFDLICLFDVLEHIEEDLDTLIAVKKLLAERGRILITVPAYRWLWSAHDEFLHHKRRYNTSEIKAKTKEAGLRALKISYFNSLLFPLVALVRIKDRIFGGDSPSGMSIPVRGINNALRFAFSSSVYFCVILTCHLGFLLWQSLRRTTD